MPNALCIQSKINHHHRDTTTAHIQKSNREKRRRRKRRQRRRTLKTKRRDEPPTSTATGVVVAFGVCCIIGVAIIISVDTKTRDINTTTPNNIQNNVPFDTSSLFPKKRNKKKQKMNKTLNTSFDFWTLKEKKRFPILSLSFSLSLYYIL